MGNKQSRFAKSSQDAVDQYRSRLINQLDMPRLPEERRLELQDELDRFMDLSEKEQEVCAALQLGSVTSSSSSRRPRTSSRSSRGSSTAARPVASIVSRPTPAFLQARTLRSTKRNHPNCQPNRTEHRADANCFFSLPLSPRSLLFVSRMSMNLSTE